MEDKKDTKIERSVTDEETGNASSPAAEEERAVDETPRAAVDGSEKADPKASSLDAEAEADNVDADGDGIITPDEVLTAIEATSPDTLSEQELKDEKKIDELAKKYDRSQRPRDKKTVLKSVARIAFLVVIIVASVFILFGITDYITGGKKVGFVEFFSGVKVPQLIILLLVVILSYVLESSKYCYLFKLSTKKCYFRTSLKVTIFGKFYDGITPFAIGGQPFQMYYLHKKKLPAGISNAVPLIRFFFGIVVWCVFCGAMLILSPILVGQIPATIAIYVLAWVSLIINLIIPIAVLLVTLFPKGGKKLVIKIFYLMQKMHLIKSYYSKSKSFLRELEDYRAAFKNFFRHPGHYIPMIILCIVECVITTSIPYCIVVAFTPVEGSMLLYWQIMSLCCLAQLAASLVPTPGTAGAVELTSGIMFATVSGIDAYAGWVILLWRIFIYYFFILTGMGVNIFDTIRSFVRQHRAKRNART